MVFRTERGQRTNDSTTVSGLVRVFTRSAKLRTDKNVQIARSAISSNRRNARTIFGHPDIIWRLYRDVLMDERSDFDIRRAVNIARFGQSENKTENDN